MVHLKALFFLLKMWQKWIENDLSSVNKLVSLVDDSEKGRNNIPTPGGSQETWFRPQAGERLLYPREYILPSCDEG